jgi:hypothetical protein
VEYVGPEATFPWIRSTLYSHVYFDNVTPYIPKKLNKGLLSSYFANKSNSILIAEFIVPVDVYYLGISPDSNPTGVACA